MDHFKLDVVRLWKLFTLIEEGYHSTNPYHNSIHATDVTQAMHCFLQETKIMEHLEPVEIMASLIGAVTHDLDHPGVNQPFLIATSNHLAALYENTSVLENHHWRSAVGCLLESGVAEQIHSIRPQLEKQISSLILATDITRQQEFLTKFRDYLTKETLDMRKQDDRHFILQIALKCADISNPCRPWDISKKWSQKVCEEFFRQGDYERQLNLPVTSLCDRYSTSVPKIQVGFFKFVVTPLFDEWHRFLGSKLSTKMMYFLKYNQVQWEKRVAAEMAEETRTEMSDAEVLEEDESVHDAHADGVDEEDIAVDLSDSSEVLLPDKVRMPRRSSLQVPNAPTKYDRRLSMPLNPPKIILPTKDLLSRDAIREELEAKLDADSFSLLSSDSDSAPRNKSSDNSVPERERPLSAETLVPDLSIATMSNSACADHLNRVMHGAGSVSSTAVTGAANTSKHLVRQQTFPPLQPYGYQRARYMSATGDISTYPETLIESRSSSSESQTEDNRGVLGISKKDSFKREKEQNIADKQGCKMAKLSITMMPGQKENLDPSFSKKNLNRRRGSAPVAVALPPKTAQDDATSLAFKTCDKFMRRGSMPSDSLKNSKSLNSHTHFVSFLFPTSLEVNSINKSHSIAIAASQFVEQNLPQTSSLATNQRRSSVPSDNPVVAANRNNCHNGKSKNRKKSLRRRSSGGAEILCSIVSETEPSSSSSPWYRFKRSETTKNRSDLDLLLSRRRGSLPVEVLTTCNSGETSLIALLPPSPSVQLVSFGWIFPAKYNL